MCTSRRWVYILPRFLATMLHNALAPAARFAGGLGDSMSESRHLLMGSLATGDRSERNKRKLRRKGPTTAPVEAKLS